jgi:K+-sensing histidine kinase KdpD
VPRSPCLIQTTERTSALATSICWVPSGPTPVRGDRDRHFPDIAYSSIRPYLGSFFLSEVLAITDSDHRDRLVYLAAIAGPVAIGAVLYPARGHVTPANLALVFVVDIVAIASTGRRGAAAVAAVISALSFDFFLTVPYLQFQIAHSADVTTAVLLLVVGLAVGGLAVRGHRARHRAEAGSDRLHRIHGLAERIAAGEEPDFLVMAVANELRDVLSLQDCRFAQTPVAGGGARIEPDGSVTMAGLSWQTDRWGLPTRRVVLPVRGDGTVLGSFVLTPTPAMPIEPEQCIVAVALADQLGAALISR